MMPIHKTFFPRNYSSILAEDLYQAPLNQRCFRPNLTTSHYWAPAGATAQPEAKLMQPHGTGPDPAYQRATEVEREAGARRYCIPRGQKGVFPRFRKRRRDIECIPTPPTKPTPGASEDSGCQPVGVRARTFRRYRTSHIPGKDRSIRERIDQRDKHCGHVQHLFLI